MLTGFGFWSDLGNIQFGWLIVSEETQPVSVSPISQLSAPLLYITDSSFPWMTGQTEDGINLRLLQINIIQWLEHLQISISSITHTEHAFLFHLSLSLSLVIRSQARLSITIDSRPPVKYILIPPSYQLLELNHLSFGSSGVANSISPVEFYNSAICIKCSEKLDLQKLFWQ